MKIQQLINIWATIILTGCSGPAAQNNTPEDKYADMIRTSIKDNASKNGSDLTISSLNILQVDTVTRHTLDSQLIIKTSGRLEICTVMADLYLSMSATSARIRALDKKMKKGALRGVASNDIEDDAYKARLYKDSAKYYGRLLDSLNTRKKENNGFSDTLYQIRSFLQATEKNNVDSVNHFGVQYYYITKDNKVLNLTDIEAGKF